MHAWYCSNVAIRQRRRSNGRLRQSMERSHVASDGTRKQGNRRVLMSLRGQVSSPVIAELPFTMLPLMHTRKGVLSVWILMASWRRYHFPSGSFQRVSGKNLDSGNRIIILLSSSGRTVSTGSVTRILENGRKQKAVAFRREQYHWIKLWRRWIILRSIHPTHHPLSKPPKQNVSATVLHLAVSNSIGGDTGSQKKIALRSGAWERVLICRLSVMHARQEKKGCTP